MMENKVKGFFRPQNISLGSQQNSIASFYCTTEVEKKL